MKRLVRPLAVAALFALSGCAYEGHPRLYNNNTMSLVAGNYALFPCLCYFVMDMSGEDCHVWSKEIPDVGHVTVDLANKRVVGTAFITWSASAQLVDERHGCILE